MKDNIKEQVYNGKTAAEMLKNARTNGRRKRELSTLANVLCIREEYLDALENGRYDDLPELVYLLGFARNYAIELDLDPNVVVQKIKLEKGLLTSEEEEKLEEMGDINIALSRGPIQSAKIFLKKYWKLLVAVLAAIAISASILVVALSKKTEESNYYQKEIVSDDMPKIKFDLPIREQFGTEYRKDAQIIFQALSETWLKVDDANGRNVISRVMVPGDIYYAPNGGRATVGNAGGLAVWVNGEKAPALGPDGARRSDIVLTPANLIVSNQ
jgi:hypothetical protein